MFKVGCSHDSCCHDYSSSALLGSTYRPIIPGPSLFLRLSASRKTAIPYPPIPRRISHPKPCSTFPVSLAPTLNPIWLLELEPDKRAGPSSSGLGKASIDPKRPNSPNAKAKFGYFRLTELD